MVFSGEKVSFPPTYKLDNRFPSYVGRDVHALAYLSSHDKIRDNPCLYQHMNNNYTLNPLSACAVN